MLLYPLDCSACPSPLIHSWNPFGCKIAVFMASWRKLHVLSYVIWAHLPKDVCLAGSSGCEVLKELIDSACGVQCFAVGTLCAWSFCVFPWHNQRIGVIKSQEICISPASCFDYIHNMRQHHILSRCYFGSATLRPIWDTQQPSNRVSVWTCLDLSLAPYHVCSCSFEA